jgi:predicted alpha/beta superfamily hydrolase
VRRLSILFVFLIAGPGLLLSAQENGSPLVIGQTFTIDSRILRETRRMNVYLPPGYEKSSGAPLPVLYMPDGGMAEDFLHIAGLMQVSVGNGTMRPFLLVGIENTERRRDMTGPTENPEDKKIAPRVGGSATFRKFIAKELMPEIAHRYRVTDETAIVGESAAGLFIVETLFLEPAMFDTYIAVDPSLWWNNEELAKKAETRLAKIEARATLFLTSSSDGNNKPVQALADAWTKAAPKTLQLVYEPMPAETHATTFHPAALKAFRALFKPQEQSR